MPCGSLYFPPLASKGLLSKTKSMLRSLLECGLKSARNVPWRKKFWKKHERGYETVAWMRISSTHETCITTEIIDCLMYMYLFWGVRRFCRPIHDTTCAFHQETFAIAVKDHGQSCGSSTITRRLFYSHLRLQPSLSKCVAFIHQIIKHQ